MPVDNERKGLPSASSALQDALCPGRFRLQAQWDEACPETEPELEGGAGNGSADAEDIDRDREAGKRIHLLYAGKECPGASFAEQERAERALQVDESMKAQWLGFFDLEPLGDIQELRETRWWLYGDSGKEIYSGQTDAVWIRGSIGGPCDILVGDLKGLFGYHDPASLNMQIRRYIALIAWNVSDMGYTELRSAAAYLNQPAKTMKPVLTQFTTGDISKAVAEMLADVKAISEPNAPRVAGSVQCKNCRAVLICAEYQEAEGKIIEAVSPAAIAADPQPPDKKSLEASVKLLSGEQLARLLPWIPALTNACELAEAEAKRRLRINEESVPGYRLWPNSARQKVDDVTKVYNRFASEYGVQGEEFTKLCSITKKGCTELLRAKSGLKGDALNQKLGEMLADATREVQVSSSLQKVKP